MNRTSRAASGPTAPYYRSRRGKRRASGCCAPHPLGDQGRDKRPRSEGGASSLAAMVGGDQVDHPDIVGLDLLAALHDHPVTRHVMLMIVTTVA